MNTVKSATTQKKIANAKKKARPKLSNPVIDEMIAKKEADMERIWQIVNKLTYKQYLAMQRMLAPVESEDEF